MYVYMCVHIYVCMHACMHVSGLSCELDAALTVRFIMRIEHGSASQDFCVDTQSCWHAGIMRKIIQVSSFQVFTQRPRNGRIKCWHAGIVRKIISQLKMRSF
jgi:hypothetical protein